jgi:hypothetical protein
MQSPLINGQVLTLLTPIARGCVGRTKTQPNGLIRQYFHKGTDFSTVTDEAVALVMKRLTDCTYYLKPLLIELGLVKVKLKIAS